MSSKSGALLLLLTVATRGSAQDLSPKELLYVLNIQTWRVRVPASDDHTWTFKVIPKELRKPFSSKPTNLSRRANQLLALRGIGENKFDFVLPGPSGTSRGVLDLCEAGLNCEYYDYSWLEKLECSADGDQCALAEFTVGFGKEPTHYLVLVQARSKPYAK